MSLKSSRYVTYKFLIWCVFFAAGLYYVFPNLFKITTTERFNASRLKLGIDLKGGTYITLGVDLEKAIEARIGSEVRIIETILKNKNMRAPESQSAQAGVMSLSFADDYSAQEALNVIKKEVPSLSAKLNGKQVTCSLISSEEKRVRNDSVDQVENVIANRLGGLGVEGVIVQRHGLDKIVVQIPGVDDPARVRELITKRANLEFKIVQQASHDRAGSSSREAVSGKQLILDAFDGDLPYDKIIIPGENVKEYEDDETHGSWYLVSRYADLTGDHIVDARVTYGEYGQPEVSFKLDASGGKIFKDLTSENIGKQLGIIIDNVMFSAPTLQSAISREGRITGRYTFETARDLAIVLRAGAFQAPVTYQEERRIGPSLGQDSINKGLLSCIVGLLLVFMFSVFYYRFGGLLAFLALIYNLFLILLFLSYFDATLTLPGIAGMVLTIGMAIDASILIYEKIREELNDNQPYKTAMTKGFSGAMAVIIDSNITTFLTGLVLFWYGGPSIRGFAITLMVGIVATILAGVYFLRSLFEFLFDRFGIKPIKF
jgi:preprotein translocase subunit SecD